MTFTKRFETLLKKSNDHIIKFNLNSGINIEEYNQTGDLLYSKSLAKGNFTFVDFYFDIAKDDSLYGIINNKRNSLVYIFQANETLTKTTLLNYDGLSFELKFIYIKRLNSINHVLFYLINRHDSNKVCTLIHYYEENKKWVRTEVNKFSFGILSNFVVNISENFLRVFYFKCVNNFEEIFLSTFDIEKKIWLNPIKITNSHKFKVYLSVINTTSKDFYLTFSENNKSNYYCTTIALTIENNLCTIKNYVNINKTIACMFPHLILYKHKLYAQWIEYNDLYTSISLDMGKTWGKPSKNNFPFFPFQRYDYKSNSKKDYEYKFITIYCEESSSDFLGLPNEK